MGDRAKRSVAPYRVKLRESERHSGLRVQACGDAHLSTFGAFTSPDRELLFDLNDFDETLPGPWEWDHLKRLAASLAVARRAPGGAPASAARCCLRRCAPTARRCDVAEMGNLAVWYSMLTPDTLTRALSADKADRKKAVKKRMKAGIKAETKDSMRHSNG